MADKRHQYGDAPLDLAYEREMKAIAQVLDVTFNGDIKGPTRKTGFVLLVFPFNEREGRCNYISNGANRADIIKLLREQANRFEADTGQVGHA